MDQGNGFLPAPQYPSPHSRSLSSLTQLDSAAGNKRDLVRDGLKCAQHIHRLSGFVLLKLHHSTVSPLAAEGSSAAKLQQI